jgi:hypothetical protein
MTGWLLQGADLIASDEYGVFDRSTTQVPGLGVGVAEATLTAASAMAQETYVLTDMLED